MLRLRLVGTCTLALDPHHERRAAPLLHVYFPSNVSDECTKLELAELHHPGDAALYPLVAELGPGACFCAEIDAQIDYPLVEGAGVQAVLNSLASGVLNFDAYCFMHNDHEELCQNQAGVAMIALAEVVGPAARQRGSHVRVDLLYPMLGAEYAPKGCVLIDLAQTQLTWRGKPVADSTVVRSSWTVPQLVSSPCADFIARQESKYGQCMKSTWAFMNNINMFEFVDRTGCLPVAAYIRSKLGKTSEKYYENAARQALRIVGVTEQEALARWGTPTTSERDCRYAAYWLSALLSLYVQTCDYLKDAVIAWSREKHGFTLVDIEWFYQARVRNGTIDCEDASMETMVEAMELERLRNVQSPLVRLAQRVKASFYCVLLLDAVSGIEINLSRDAAPRHLDAHMNSALISKHHFASMTRDAPERGGPTPAEAAAAACYPPIVMMEGTGPLDPNGVEHAHADDGAEAALMQVFSKSRTVRARARQIFHYDSTGKQQSPFYKTVKLMATAELEQRGGRRFLWMLCDGRTKTAGVEFQAIAAASKTVITVPEDELSPEEMATIDAYSTNLHPQPALLAPSEGPLAPHMVTARAQVERLRTEMARIVAMPTPKAALRTAIREVKHHNFDSHETLLRELIADAQRGFGGQIRLVSFAAEEFVATPDHGFFQLIYGMEL